MRDLLWGGATVAVVVAVATWIFVSDYTAALVNRASEREERDRWQADHTASRETWGRCRSVCGDAAALLPMGDGTAWVVCSCVPAYAKPVPSPGPK